VTSSPAIDRRIGVSVPYARSLASIPSVRLHRVCARPLDDPRSRRSDGKIRRERFFFSFAFFPDDKKNPERPCCPLIHSAIACRFSSKILSRWPELQTLSVPWRRP